MSIRVFDFRCDAGHSNEMFVESDTISIQCPSCGKIAHRQIAAPRAQLDGCSGDFPGEALKWEKRRESHMAFERKNQERHGTYR